MAQIQIQQWMQTVHFLSVENTLQRGFTITRNQKGEAVSKSKNLKKGDIITTLFKEGEHKSKIQ